tara:strand:- start:708 stop:3182 length:2475 start_codon:yes stop_codon:yes gene_type:complete
MPELTEEELKEYENALARGDVRRPEEIKQDATETSGLYDAILSGLSNDETARLRWVASKRFPEAEGKGIDPVDYYYVDEDGDVAYMDPISGKHKKEFQEYDLFGFGMDAEDVGGSVFPTLQFVSEVVGGVGGLIGGGLTFGLPGAVGGGVGGTAAAGGTMYGVRAGLSQMLDGPEMNTHKMTKDLAWSSAFGGIPFGAPAKAFPQFAQGLVTKFPGVDGRKQLQILLSEGGESVEEKIAFAQNKFGVTLTRPEAQMLASRGTQIQYYLAKQPNSQKLWDFYHNRNIQVQNIADEFFTEIQTGKYAREGVKNKLTGKGSLDAPLDVAKASDSVLKKLALKRQERAGKIYDDAFGMPDVKIDVSDLVKSLDDKLADKNIKGKLRKSLEAVKESLIDQNTKQLKNTTEGLHNSLSQDFRPLIESLTKDNQQFIKREVSRIREQVSGRLKEANPLYKQATEVYDPTKGHLQVLERSIINALAKSVEKGGAQTANMANRLFKGTASPKEIRNLKRLIQTEDPQAWQNLKGAWLQTQFDDAVTGTTNVLGANNKFLASIGIRNVDTAFPRLNPSGNLTASELELLGPEIAKVTARGRKAKVWEAILEPDELDNFVDLMDLMQAVSYISTRSGSPTQSLQSLAKIINEEGATGLGKIKQYGVGIFNIVPRLINRGFDDVSQNILNTQKEVYEDALIEALINPKKAVQLRQYLDSIKPNTYLATQAFMRGGLESLENITTSIDERNKAIAEEQEEYRGEKLKEEYEQQQLQQSNLENLQGSINNFQMPQLNAPLFEAESGLEPTEILSPTIIPDERDREIAMRRQLGIAGLV